MWPNNEITIGNQEVGAWEDFLSGDDNALGFIYSQNIDRLYNYGRQFTANHSLVKDSIQDVFINLIDCRDRLKPAKSPKTYLFACLRRKILEGKSKLKKESDIFTDSLDEGFYITIDESSFFIDSKLSLDEKKLLEQHCNALPVRQREIIIMRFFENLSYEEIAEIMGLANAKTVRTMMYRGINKLTQTLSPYKSQLIKIILLADLIH